MGRAEQVSSRIRVHDDKLFCDENTEGKLCVYRKSMKWENYLLADGSLLRFARPTPHLIMALTHNWQASGYNVDWGIEPIMARLRAMDLWNRDLATQCEIDTEKHNQNKAREYSNNTESFLKEFRRDFAKTFKDVNTSNMKKIDKRKTDEKRIKEF